MWVRVRAYAIGAASNQVPALRLAYLLLPPSNHLLRNLSLRLIFVVGYHFQSIIDTLHETYNCPDENTETKGDGEGRHWLAPLLSS